MQVDIRQELPTDREAAELLVKRAFEDLPYSDRKEHEFVHRIRQSPHFIPDLSLVAELHGKLVGYLMLTPVVIEGVGDVHYNVLSLGPLAVDPAHQRMGIGSALMQEALDTAKSLGYEAIVVMGAPAFFERFCFRTALHWGISLPFPAPDRIFLARELVKDALKTAAGTVQFPEAFHFKGLEGREIKEEE